MGGPTGGDALPEVVRDCGAGAERAAEQASSCPGPLDARFSRVQIGAAPALRFDHELAVTDAEAHERAASVAAATAHARTLGLARAQAVAPSSWAASWRWAGTPQ